MLQKSYKLTIQTRNFNQGLRIWIKGLKNWADCGFSYSDFHPVVCHMAAKIYFYVVGSVSILRKLVDCGGKLELGDLAGRTPLHTAAYSGKQY